MFLITSAIRTDVRAVQMQLYKDCHCSRRRDSTMAALKVSPPPPPPPQTQPRYQLQSFICPRHHTHTLSCPGYTWLALGHLDGAGRGEYSNVVSRLATLDCGTHPLGPLLRHAPASSTTWRKKE